MRAVDTNILFYAHDPRDAVKQDIAVSLIRSLTDGVLVWQVACEYLSASRKLESLGYSRADAWRDIRDLRYVWSTISSQSECPRHSRKAPGPVQSFVLGRDDYRCMPGRKRHSTVL